MRHHSLSDKSLLRNIAPANLQDEMQVDNVFTDNDNIIKKTRNRFTKDKKVEIRKHYQLTLNYAATARAFNINESTVRNIVKTPLFSSDDSTMNAHHKGAGSGAGRPLSYPLEIESELVEWIRAFIDTRQPIPVMLLRQKAKQIIRPYNPSFTASRGWVGKFFSRNQLSTFSLSW